MDEDLRLAAIEASKLFKKGKYDDAVDICTLGISDYPQYSSLYLILAKSYLALGNVSEAHKVFESASKFFVNDPLINTLKDILEATPTLNTEPPKKKTQPPNDTLTIVQESKSSNTETVQIEESISLPNTSTEFETNINEELSLQEDLIQEEALETHDVEEEIVLEQSFNEAEVESESFQDEILIENEDSINIEEEISDDNFNEIQSNDIEENELKDEDFDNDPIEYDDVLSGFDQIVSTFETVETEEQNEGTPVDENISLSESTSSTVQFVSFEMPLMKVSSNNFIKKIRTNISPIEALQFSVEKQQFLTVLPSLSVVADSVNKIHHLDDFHIELDNPLLDMNIVSNITNEQMIFEDTYISKRRKIADIVVFDNSIEELDSIESLYHFNDKKA